MIEIESATATKPAPIPFEPMRRLPSHFPALDGVRGLAILLVVVGHFLPDASILSSASKSALAGFRIAASAGWTGVDLFFVLSGFLITGILSDTRSSPKYFRNFYMRRSLRIFPLYYGTLILVFVVGPTLGFRGITSGIGGDQGWFWLYGVNILAAVRGGTFPMVHFWSLSVEEQFYLVWPFVVLSCRRETLMKICIAMAAFAPILRWIAVSQWNVFAAYCLTPCRVDALAIGALGALAIRGSGGIEPVAAFARRAAMVTVPALALLFCWRGTAFEGDPWIDIAGFSLVDLVSGSLVLAAISDKSSWRPLLDNLPLKALGKYSYGIYVLHFFVMGALQKVDSFGRISSVTGSPKLAALVHITLGATLSFAVAWVSWHAFEKHFLKLKRYFDYVKPR